MRAATYFGRHTTRRAESALGTRWADVRAHAVGLILEPFEAHIRLDGYWWAGDLWWPDG
jgi:hypothetical protein